MTAAVPPTARWAVIAAGVVAYALLAHYSANADAAKVPWLGLAVALTPSLVLLAWLAGRRAGWLGVLLVVVGSGLLLWRTWEALERHFGWIYLAQHLGTYGALAGLFGLTLAEGRKPLCTRFAEAVRGPLADEVVRYTRGLTLAWTWFFVAMSTVSAVLYLSVSLDAWSIFANFLSLPLVLLMFAVEHLVRARRLPHLERTGIRQSILAFWTTAKVGAGASARVR